jgi:hypothetical protein
MAALIPLFIPLFAVWLFFVVMLALVDAVAGVKEFLQ